MESNLDNNLTKNKFSNFYKNNKLKIFSILIILFIILISYTFLKINAEKRNNFIAERYVQAGIFLASGKKEKSFEIFEEVILSKNKFYSILALNTILDTENDIEEKKFLNYFEKVLDSVETKDQKDLLIFKKSLFLYKNSKDKMGEKLLKGLIDDESKLSPLAQEILKK